MQLSLHAEHMRQSARDLHVSSPAVVIIWSDFYCIAKFSKILTLTPN